MAIEKPDFILVPGAWHEPSAFQPTTTILENKGFKVHGVTLPSVGASPHLKSFDPDVEAIRSVVNNVLASGKDAVILVHSYGGVVGAEALSEYVNDLKTGNQKAGHGRILRLIYLSAFVLPAGLHLLDPLGDKPLPWFVIKGDGVTCSDPQEVFYNDIDPATAGPYIAALKEHSFPTFFSNLTCEPWKVIPSTYITCKNDNALPLVAQIGMFTNARVGEPKAFDVVEEIDSSHSPFISQPDVLANMMIKAATTSAQN